MEKIILNTDGGARGNPGPAAIGISIRQEDGTVVKEIGEYIGEGTNNVAEYTAVLRAFETAKELGNSEATALDFYLDSELVVRQLTGVYKIKDANLKLLAGKIKELEKDFGGVSYTHVRREENKRADELVNEALDAQA